MSPLKSKRNSRGIIFIIEYLTLLVCFAQFLHAETIKVGGTGGALGTMQVLADAFKKSEPDANIAIVPGLGSGGGRRALEGGAIDIAVTGKAGTEAEKMEGAKALLYGRTPLAFATAKNTAASLTLRELVEVYGVKKTTWADGSRLRLILRPATDSDTAVLNTMSLAMADAVKTALAREGMKIAVTDGDSADAIQNTPGAIGTLTLALILSEKRPLKVIAVNGVSPSAKTLADGSYPYFKSMYIITGTKPSELTQRFVAFVFSKQGAHILTELGHLVVHEKGAP